MFQPGVTGIHAILERKCDAEALKKSNGNNSMPVRRFRAYALAKTSNHAMSNEGHIDVEGNGTRARLLEKIGSESIVTGGLKARAGTQAAKQYPFLR